MRATDLRNRKYLHDYLTRHPCVDCGETDTVVLQFDHVRGDKVMKIANLVHGASITRLQAEIEKCEVRCANCHIRRHARERGYYRSVN